MKYPSRKFVILTLAVIVETMFVFIGRFKTKLPTAQPQKRHIVKLDFIGANPNIQDSRAPVSHNAGVQAGFRVTF